MDKEFKPFQPILVKQGVWRAAYFSHYGGNGNVITTGGGVYCNEFCIPYEGNEVLLGTDSNPKPKRWRAEMGEVYWYVGTDAVAVNDCDNYQTLEDSRYLAGNYFRTQEEADEMAEKFKKILNDE